MALGITIKTYRLYGHKTAIFTRGKAVAASLLLLIASVGGTAHPHKAMAAPTYSAIAQLGQWDMTTDAPERSGPNPDGLDQPRSLALDDVHHRLFLADTNNNRVLVFGLDVSNHLVDKTPDFVLGQADFIHGRAATTRSTLSAPLNIAYDATDDRLFVDDTFNNRILVFDTASITNGENATHVLGQADFTTGDPSTAAANTIANSRAITYDATRKYLYVADEVNARVLVFDVATVTDNEDAIHVLGQTDFSGTSTGCPPAGLTATQFCDVKQLAYDSVNKRLFVSDGTAQRVTSFDLTVITDGEAAVHVLGQSSLTSFVDTGFNAHELAAPEALSFDATGERLFVSELGNANRVLIFNVNPGTMTDNESASNVLGQPTFTSPGCAGDPTTTISEVCGPEGVAYDSTTHYLYVMDDYGSRGMVFDVTSISDGENAVDRIGQPNYTARWENAVPRPNATGLFEPQSTTIDPVGHHLYVIDGNSRIMIYNLDANNAPVGEAASSVLGQPDMFSNSGCSTPTTDFCGPRDVVVDSTNHRLYVSDQDYSRILMFNLDASNLPLDSTPDALLGQPDLTETGCNTGGSAQSDTLCFPETLALDATNHLLYVADKFNDRILGYDLTTTNAPVDGNADVVVGNTDMLGTSDCTNNADCLSRPNGVGIDSAYHRLYVSDSSNSRLLIYALNTANAPIDGTADYVLGQNNFDDTDCNQGASDPAADTLCSPSGITIDPANARLFVSDIDNSRILIFDLDSSGLPLDNTADGIIGQEDYTSIASCVGYTTASQLCTAHADELQATAYDAASGLFYAPDAGSNRVLAYQVAVAAPPAPTPPPTSAPGTTSSDSGGSIGGRGGYGSSSSSTPDSTTPAIVGSDEPAIIPPYASVPPPAPTDTTTDHGTVLGKCVRTTPFYIATYLPYLLLLLLLLLGLSLLHRSRHKASALRTFVAFGPPPKASTSPLFWLPVLIVGLLMLAGNSTFVLTDTCGFSTTHAAAQAVLFIVLVAGQYAAVHRLLNARQGQHA